MESNYVLLVAIFLLLVVVQCSGNGSKENVNEETGLDQNVDGKVDPVKEKVDSESISDSIGVSRVKDNGVEDQIGGLGGGVDSDASKSNLNGQSGSNEGENLVKGGRESSSEAKENANGGKDNEGDQVDVLEGGVDSDASKRNLNEQSGLREGDNLVSGGKESNAEEKGKTIGGKDSEGDRIEGSDEGDDSDASKSDLKEQSNSNEGKNLAKDEKDSSSEAKGKMNGGVDNGGDQIDVFEGDFDSDASKSNLNEQSSSNEGENFVKGEKESSAEERIKTNGGKEGDNAHKGQAELDVDAEGKKGNDEKKENPDDSVDPKKVSKEEDIIQGSVRSPPSPSLTSNDDFRVGECDSSNMCMNKRFAACLRVPGNNSPDLLLLVRNKGKGTITLNISAPSFVWLEETNVELEENQDRKVKISIKSYGTGNLIVLKDGTGDGECSLDFKDLITHNTAKSYVNLFSPTMVFIFAAAILMMVSRWMCKSIRWRQLTRSGSKYQRLDMELPVRREPDVNGDWDNSWGDNWDDEEAPSLPITSSLSFKGLASRQLSKEGWKD